MNLQMPSSSGPNTTLALNPCCAMTLAERPGTGITLAEETLCESCNDMKGERHKQ